MARPGRVRLVLTQAPYLLTFAVFGLVWIPDLSWPWGYLLWAWCAVHSRCRVVVGLVARSC
jgi:hypothetical protein